MALTASITPCQPAFRVSGQAFDRLASQLLAFTEALGDDLERQMAETPAAPSDAAWLRAYALFSRQVLALHAERRAQHAAARWMIVDDSVDALEEQRKRLKP